MKKNPLYKERMQLIADTVKLRSAKRVPVFPTIEQWAQAQAGISIPDSFLKDPTLIYEAYKNITKDVYLDLCYGTGNSIPLRMMQHVGGGLYTVTETGVQIVGGKGLVMEESDYPELIKDPKRFFMNTILPRKFKAFQGDKDTVLSTWVQAIKDVIGWKIFDKKTSRLIEGDLGIPIFASGRTILPPDFILDFLRDFVGTSSDIRRCPARFIDACNALDPVLKEVVGMMDSHPDEYSFILTPLHLATYLRPKDFEKLYWPYMKDTAEFIAGRGSSVAFACENDWTRYIEYLADLPTGHTYVQVDEGDMLQYKKALGGKICIGGGMKQSLLKMGTVDECLDYAKWLIDNIAPGGGYVFGLDKNLLNGTDGKRENVAAVTNYVHEHGVF